MASCSDSAIELTAPLQPNINHKNTAFGGSLSVVAILAAWSLLYMRLKGVKNEIVIQQSEMNYLSAAKGDFIATSQFVASPGWQRFDRAFKQKGKGRIQLASQVHCRGEVVATFQGTYVAFNKETSY